MHVYLAKLLGFESTDFVSVMIDDVGWSHHYTQFVNEVILGIFVKLSSDECHKTSLMTSQHWFR